MENTTEEVKVKRPKGRPNGTIERRYRTVYLTDSEHAKVKNYIKTIKETEV